MKNAYFPLFYDITGWNICFFGAGNVAERRIKTLLSYPCRIYVVAKHATENIQKAAEGGTIVWKQKEISTGTGIQQIEEICKDLKRQYREYFFKEKEFRLIFACTEKREVNQMIYDYCRVKKILINVADCREQSGFYFPGLLKKEDLVIGVTGNGNDHKEVRHVMDRLRDLFYKEGGE